uniref:Uncharacterized protein n=1 Tax=Acrobeloides nanus TaxID=290746 RepID=A0A914BX32_9BILA
MTSGFCGSFTTSIVFAKFGRNMFEGDKENLYSVSKFWVANTDQFQGNTIIQLNDTVQFNDDIHPIYIPYDDNDFINNTGTSLTWYNHSTDCNVSNNASHYFNATQVSIVDYVTCM